MTKVKFYKDKDGDILAVFPEEIADGQFNILCYAHIGQHSACSKEYVKGLKLATPIEYNELLHELIGQGYDDLQVITERMERIEAGKIWQIYKDGEPDNILFEGSHSKCKLYIAEHCPRSYKKGEVRLAKVIFETT